MKCNVTSFVKVERENEMPYFIIKATGVEGDESANVVDEDGCINPFAMMSRRFNFTKTLFPSTDKQVEQLEKLYEVDKDGKVVKGAPIRLMSVSWATGTEFYIRKEGSVTGVYETEEEVTEKVVRNGKTIEVTKTKYIPKVFKSVNLTLLKMLMVHALKTVGTLMLYAKGLLRGDLNQVPIFRAKLQPTLLR